MPRLTERWAYEQRGALSDSKLRDRVLFLEAIPELRPQAVTDLFTAAFISFLSFAASRFRKFLADLPALPANPSANDVLRHLRNIPQEEVELAVTGGWAKLQRLKGTKELREKLQEWARAHNLTADWCLDHAVNVLKVWMYDEYVRRLGIIPLRDDDFARGWLDPTTDMQFNLAFSRAMLFTDTHPNNAGDPVPFAFEHEGVRFEAEGWNYLQQGKEEWKKGVEQKFDTFRQHRLARKLPVPKGMLTALRKELADYVRKQDAAKRAIVKEHGLVKRSRSYADHGPEERVRWLVMYQIPPCQRYAEIAEQAGQSNETIRKYVTAAAESVELPLRAKSLHAGSPAGKPRRSPHRASR